MQKAGFGTKLQWQELKYTSSLSGRVGLTWTLVSGFLQRLGGKQSNTWIAYFAGVDFWFILLVLIQGWNFGSEIFSHLAAVSTRKFRRLFNQLLSLACLNGYNVFSRIYFDGSASRQVRWSISTELAGTFRMASVERTGNSVEPSIFTGALAYFQLRSPSYLTITLCSVGLHIHADSCHLIWSCFRQRIR